MSTIALDLFIMVSSTADTGSHTVIVVRPRNGIDFRDRIGSPPFATCIAHMRHSAALRVAVSCACQRHRLHRYLKRRPRRSMLLLPHARQRCLANCRSRSGSSLVKGRCGRKGTELAHGSVLFQRASPPQHAKFHWMSMTAEAPATYGRNSSSPNNGALASLGL